MENIREVDSIFFNLGIWNAVVTRSNTRKGDGDSNERKLGRLKEASLSLYEQG